MQTITISNEAGENNFMVTQGDRFADLLNWDEMICQVIELTHPKIGKGRYQMRTEAEKRVIDARRALQIAERALDAERANTGIAF